MPSKKKLKSFHRTFSMMNRIHLLTGTFILFWSVNIFSDAFHTIRWKAIPSALGYSVEIKDESGKVITQATKKSSLTLKMARGKYSYRIALLNKLNVVEKWSEWRELEVKAVAPPVVDSDTSMVQTEGNKEKITFSGENLYEGTKAFIVQNGKRIPAKIETSRDGKTSIVTVDKKFVDPNKDHTVILENPKFDPIQVSISGELASHPPEHIQAKNNDSTPSGESDFQPESKIKFWSMFWRQAVLPGWGHAYINHDKTAYAYFGLLGVSVVNASAQYTHYQAEVASFRTAQDYSEGMRAAIDPIGVSIPFYLNTLETKVDEQRNRLNNSVSAIGGIYAVAIAHIIYTGTKNSLGTRKHSFFEMLWRQAVLPGWGHQLIGDHATAYTYYGLLGGTALNLGYQNYVYRAKVADYRTMEDNAEAARAINPDDLLVPTLINSKAGKINEQANRLNNSLGAVGVVYLTSILHIIVTAHLRKYSDSSTNKISFGITPDMPIGMFRSYDPSHLRADFQYSFYY